MNLLEVIWQKGDIVIFLILSTLLAYMSWFHYDLFLDLMVKSNRNNPFFKYYAPLVKSDVNKWFTRLMALGMFCVATYVFIIAMLKI